MGAPNKTLETPTLEANHCHVGSSVLGLPPGTFTEALGSPNTVLNRQVQAPVFAGGHVLKWPPRR